MGGFMSSPAQLASAPPPPSQTAASPMDTLMGQQFATSPQAAQAQAQAGSLNQLRQIELAIGGLSQIVQQISAGYPGSEEPVRQTMAALDQAKQSLLGLLVPIMSGMPDAQSQGPTYMGG